MSEYYGQFTYRNFSQILQDLFLRFGKGEKAKL